MNASTLAQAAYASSTAPIRTERSTEYDIFARITQKLKNINPKNNYSGFVTALHENRQLWSLLAVDVADAGNKLAPQLRAQIFYLAEFTSLHTSKILAGEAEVQDLVEINTSIMRGLNNPGAQR